MRGSLRRRGHDSWEIRVSLGKNARTGRYEYVTRNMRGTKREAERAAAHLVAEVDKGGHQFTEKVTVSELLDRWLDHISAQGRSPNTLAGYKSVINNKLKPAIGDVRIDKLTGAGIDAVYTELLKRGLSSTTVLRVHNVLSASLRQALRWGWIDRNPVERATAPSRRHREIPIPTSDDIRRLLVECDRRDRDLGSLIYVAATTGLRRGELCGLRWADVDLPGATLTVRRSITDTNGAIAVKDPKTHAARRIALDVSTVEVLRRHSERMSERSMAATGKGLDGKAYVWSQVLDGSEPYRPGRVTSNFITLRERVGLDHVTFHALRHFSATVLAAQGVGIRTIAGRLGHVDPNLTLRTYAHFLDVADREAAVAMGQTAALLAPPA